MVLSAINDYVDNSRSVVECSLQAQEVLSSNPEVGPSGSSVLS